MLAINVSIPNRTVADVVQFRPRKLHLMQCNTVYIYSSLFSLKHGLSLSLFSHYHHRQTSTQLTTNYRQRSVGQFVRLFPFYLLKKLTFDLDLLHVYGS